MLLDIKHHKRSVVVALFFFFNDTATTEIYTLSLHDALPIYAPAATMWGKIMQDKLKPYVGKDNRLTEQYLDRKSTRLNSSHSQISYAVFCLKKKITMRKNSLQSMLSQS